MAPVDNRHRPAPRPPPPPPPPRPNPVAAFGKGVADSVRRAPDNIAKDPVGVVKKGADAAVGVADGIQGVRETGGQGMRDGVRDAWRNPVSTMNKNYLEASKPSMGSGPGELARQGVRAGGLGINASNVSGDWAKAGEAWNKGFGPGATSNDRAEAISAGSTAVKTTLETAKGVAELTRDGANALTNRKMSKAFEAAAPNATPETRRNAVRSVGNQVLDGADNAADVAKNTVREVAGRGPGAKAALREGMGGDVTNREARSALKTATTEAAEAGLEKSAAKTAAKAAGRFVPGANVAIAAMDTANAAATLADGNASVTKKVTSVVTAVGSIAAATNIPGVSQVGGAVSTVSDFVGGLFG